MNGLRCLVVAAIVATACGGAESALQPSLSTATTPSTLPVPTTTAPVESVITVFETADNPSTDADVSFELDECVMIAPGHWRYVGTVAIEESPLDVLILFGISVSDIGRGAFVDATITGSGPFEVTVFQEDMLSGARTCSIGVFTDAHHDPVYADATVEGEPLVWDAPDGTIQALGIGAITGDWYDPRRAWAELYWSGTALPFDQVLAIDPSIHGVESVGGFTDDRSLCQTVSASYERVIVRQDRNCDVHRLYHVIRDEPLAVGAFTGTMTETVERYVFRGFLDGFHIEVSSERRDDVVETLHQLRYYDNLTVAPPTTDSQWVDADRDRLVEKTLTAKDAEEITRIETSIGLVLVTRYPITKVDVIDPYAHQQSHVIARVDEWFVVTEGFGDGGWDQCSNGSRLVTAANENWAFLIVAGQKDWTVELSNLADPWFDVTTQDGVAYLDEETHPGLDIDEYAIRVLDGSGHVVDCTTYRPPIPEGVTDITYVGGGDVTTDLTIVTTDDTIAP